MKVVIFCEYYGNGGIEKVSNEIKKILEKRNDVSILCTIFNSKIYDKCKTISKWESKNTLYRFIKTILNIKKYTNEYDIVHINIHSSIGLWYALFTSKNKKIIIHAHNSNFDKNYLKIKTILNKISKKILCNKKYTYIACSKEAASFCFDKKTQYTIIENELYNDFEYDENKRKELRNKYELGKNFVIGHVGRFEKQKNHIFLVNIFKELKKLNKNSKLFLIGVGSERTKIEKRIKEDNLKDDVIILDYAKNINDYYNMFDCFLLPSIYEGDPICLYEALATSLKCFVSANIDTKKKDNLYKIELKKNPEYWANIIYENINYERKNIKMENKFEEKINRIYENEKISIIIPIYNSEKYIEKCIASVLRQTYENYELILVNDGSTDKTLEIIKKIKDERIKIISQENKGAGSARNLGLDNCIGKYVCFIDSDDTVEENYLEYMYDLIKKYDVDIVGCNYKKERKEKIFFLTENEEKINNLISLPEKICVSVFSKLYRKKVVENIRFDIDNKFEDIEFCIKTFLNAKSLVYSTKKIYNYNCIENSRSSYYFNNDRIIACTKCLNIIPRKIMNNYKTYICFNAIAITNMMILNNNYINHLLLEINDYIKNNMKSVRKSDYPFIKKMQIYVYHYNFKLYKKIYFYLKKVRHD